MELHQAVERELAAAGGHDYDAALTRVLSQASAGHIQLSQQALEGTGVAAPASVRRGGPPPGSLRTLAGAPTSQPLVEPPAAEHQSARFADALAAAAARRPDATAEDHRRSTEALLRRCDYAVAEAQVDAWIKAGGSAVAGVRRMVQ
jgi:hypothetical protein